MKRLAAIAAMSLVAFQAVSGVAVAATAHLGSGPAPAAAGSSNCGLGAVLGTWSISAGDDVVLTVDTTNDELGCEVTNGNPSPDVSVPLDDLDKVIVYAFDSGAGSGANDIADVTFDLTDGTDLVDFNDIEFTVRVEGRIVIDGSSADDRDDFDVMLEDAAFSVDEAGLDVAITYAKSYDVTDGDGDDTVDGRKVSAVGFSVTSGEGDDVIYGGAGDDALDCDDDTGVVTDPDDGFTDQCWGGDGDDTIDSGEDIVAPGDGDDEINGDVLLATYADSSAAVEIDADDLETESDAGDDDYDTSATYGVLSWAGSAKADTFYGTAGDDSFSGGGGADVAYGYDGNDSFSGGAGNDRLWGGTGADVMRGGAGDDVMKGGSGTDRLRGDSGSDEAWGGKGKDACGAEVTDSCEYSKV